ncbi:Myb/SANT-like DNA-binding domain protein [Arabidopsis thaliana]|jgi:hypothetical protein|uniref:Myb/SANT-like DNA-binding domain protein n=2 Tax=Arabidopsis thaliana TaxID=3702 RepID=Q6DYE3_ARATH|nr:Myb/SANT-like DNA-binding domain protein [Arabidopsis thaliana]NP_174306.2 Myb/SANT-like DNA-binding domain protein [Arabidopsis thaliana]AAT67561.1 hypothetical protein At1G30140 [Arabidopsis thaliana]AEE31185.1 Myb/SANT-like DNA-binding domain protein [Arabidopsis thaliana]ANM58786.1 Myb/SANT-like DNA-binding domain protein [Arabidopsis thaliana]|eukprot:NP_001319110.1 Myb/SANT-like DNA-binding domain protein [Arabidopsis thaliana]
MMEDPPRGKEKGPYNQWTPDETDVLIELIRQNWRDSSGIIGKLTVESKLLPALNKRLGCNKNHKNYMSRLKFLKNLYQSYLDLKRFSSGFGWDPETKKFTAPDEVWRDYLKAHPNHKHMQTESIDHFEDLQIIFGDVVATGSFAVGMSDSTCPRIYTVGERSQGKETVNQDENIEEVYEFSFQHPSSAEYSTSPFTFDPTTRGRSEKLLPRKRTKGGRCNSE